MKKHLLSIIASIVICALLLIGCGGGGGGGSSNNGNDLFKVINTVNKNISADSATQIGVLTSDGIQLNLSKGALSDNSNVAVRQYSNDAAMARFTENFPSLASFTVVSSLYELTAKDNKSKTLTVLEIPSEVEVALTEDLNTNKLYYAVVKQNGEWTLLPLQNNSSSNSSRLASNASRSIKMIFNTIYENLFIVAVTKKNATNSKLTYAEDFIISLNGSETSPQTITASYTQKFDNDIEASLRLTLKGDVSPDKAEISITALQNENKKISIKKSDKTYKDFDFTTAEQRGKYQTTFKLTSDLATSKLSGNTATYNFIIKAKDMKVSDMPTKLILKASVKGSSIFYSNDMQINFEKGADQPIIPEEPSTPDNPTKPEEPSTPEEPQIIVYTIKYDLDGGKLVKSNPQKYDTESDTITLNNPIKEGYTFVGWTGSNGNSPEKTVTIKTGSTGNKEFIANWNKNPADTFTVALIRGTGIATVKGDGAYKSGTKVTVSYTLENGYEFDKWSGDKTEASFTMPAKDVTMTANAKPITYNITYNLDGGSVLKANPSTYNVTTADIILNNPTKEGYSFVGWSGTGLTGNSNTKVTISKGSTGNKQFTANWNKIYTIKYDGNGNTSGTEPTDTIDSQTNIALQVSNYGTLAKGNYSFYAWNTKADGTGINVNPNEIITLSRFNELNINNKDYIILYAIWEKTKVSFELKSNKNNTDFDTINGKYRLNPNFTLLSSFAFKDSNSIQIIKDSIYITNVNNGNIKKEWDYNTNSLVISLEENLTEDTNYEIKMSNFSLEGINIIATNSLSFSTLKNITLNLNDTTKLELIYCPSGNFTMGSPNNERGHRNNEKQHNVILSKYFYIGKFEITQTQYKEIMGINPSCSIEEDGESKPVEMLSYNKAKEFCNKLNIKFSNLLPKGYAFDLPTEAQWEYACRAGTNSALNNGKELTSLSLCPNLDEVAWFNGNGPNANPSYNGTHPIGLKKPNEWGIYDMHGNVSEYCKDLYEENLGDTDITDPIGPDNGSEHTIRGGNWGESPEGCRSANRIGYPADGSGSGNIGFRLALVPIQ